MKNFVQPGDVITVAAPAGGALSGEFVKIGGLFGFAQTSADAGDDVAIATTGVFETSISAAAPVTVGAPIYWTGAALTTAATDGDAESPTAYPVIGVAVSTAAAGAAVTVAVKI
jgi:predicted RecA/RadA family phage recombinase